MTTTHIITAMVQLLLVVNHFKHYLPTYQSSTKFLLRVIRCLNVIIGALGKRLSESVCANLTAALGPSTKYNVCVFLHFI